MSNEPVTSQVTTPAQEAADSSASGAANSTPDSANGVGRTSGVGSKPKYGLVRRVLRALFWSALFSISALLIVCAALMTWLDSDSGRARLVDAINHSGVVTLKSLQGSFWSHLEVRDLVIDTEASVVQLDHGVLDWTPYSLLLGDVYLNEVALGELSIKTKPQPPMQAPSPPPSSLSLPIGLKVIELKIAQLLISGAPPLSDIRASLDSNGREHRLSLQQLQVPQGSLSAALNLSGTAPFKTAGSFVLAGALDSVQLTAVGQVQGDLRHLAVQADLNAAQVHAGIEGEIDVFAEHSYQIMRHGQVKLSQINPAQFHPDAPQAKIDADLAIEPTPSGAKIALVLHNQQVASIDQHGLPLERLTAALELVGDDVQLKSLNAQLAGQGRISASGHVKNEKLAINVSAAAINPAAFWSLQPKSNMSGQLSIAGPWLAPDVKGKISDQNLKANLSLDLGWIKPSEQRKIAVRQLELSRGSSLVSAKGEVNLLSPYDFKVDALLKRFNPAEYIKSPQGSISANIKAAGLVEPIPAVKLNYQFEDSQFNGAPLTGQGAVQLSPDRLQQADLWLALGTNRLEVKGALGKAGDQLAFRIRMPNLAAIGQGMSGLIEGQGVLSGALKTPQVQGNVLINQLKTPWDVSLEHADVKLRLQADLQGELALAGQLQQLIIGDTRVAQADIAVNGTRKAHQIIVHASGKQLENDLALSAELAGNLDEQLAWRGFVNQLKGKALQPFSVAAPISLAWTGEALRVGAGVVYIGQSELALQKFEWQDGNLNTDGVIERAVVADWLPLLGNKDIASDLVLAGRWHVEQKGVINAAVQLNRIAGDVVWKGGSAPQAMQLQSLQLDGKVNQNQLALQAQLNSPRLGRMDLSGQALLDGATWQIAPKAPFNLALRSDLPDLSVFGPLIGHDIKLAGKAKINVQRTQQGEVVNLQGAITGEGLQLRDVGTGVRLQDGVVDIALNNQQIRLQTLRFKGGQGTINATGVIELAKDGPVGSATLAAKQFTLISKTDMLLVMSGQGAIEFRDGALKVNGQFVADKGDIQFASNDVPRLSSDVIVLGREKKQLSKPLPANIELSIGLGNQFRFRGYGLDADLVGQLRLRAHSSQGLAAHGTVSVDKGEYKAYGQKLDIERGVLSFAGAVDNPGLDIIAMRRNQAVEAGVKVQGSAYSPRVTLYSEPSVPDSEKLSWLLFGHGTENMEKSDSALLLQMLNAMAAGNNGNGQGLSDQLFGAVGIDEVGYSSIKESDGTSTQVVSVSKQLAKNLRVSLDKSFNGLRDAVRFTLQLTRNWSVVSRIGTDASSVDVNYTWQFDHLLGDEPAVK